MPDGPLQFRRRHYRFNEAAGVDPADAPSGDRAAAESLACFNEAAGVDPADALRGRFPIGVTTNGFNEAAGVDPADAHSTSPSSLRTTLLQ